MLVLLYYIILWKNLPLLHYQTLVVGLIIDFSAETNLMENRKLMLLHGPTTEPLSALDESEN